MKNKTYFSYKPSKRKFIVTASLSITLFYSLQTTSVLAEANNVSSTDSSTIISDIQSNNTREETSATDSASNGASVETTNTTSDFIYQKKINGNFYFYNQKGTLLTNQWIKSNNNWHYVDATGAAVKGWYTTPDGKTWYFDPISNLAPGIARFGEITFDDKDYYYIDSANGLVKNNWIESDSGRAWAGSDGVYVRGWFTAPDGKTWYFSPIVKGYPPVSGKFARIGKKTYCFDPVNGLIRNSWFTTEYDDWFWVGSDGATVKGWFTTPNGKTWYFNPDSNNEAVFGYAEIDGKYYFFDRNNGLVTYGWVHHEGGTWSWIDSVGSFFSGWKYINGKWFYFDTNEEAHSTKFGVFQISSGTYYVDESLGMTSNNWVHLPDGSWAWAQSSGAFASGWYTTPNGKTWYFDPSDPHHPAIIGETEIDGKSYYFDEGYGLLRNGWVHRADGSWSWADSDGSLHSDWKYINGKWFYFDTKDPHHRMLTGAFQISSGTYYVDESLGMTSNNWVHLPNGSWAWAQSSGAFASGWFNTPNGKTWYFDPSNPHHPALLGEQKIEGKSYYFDEGYGLARNQWITRPDGIKRWAGPDGVLTGYKN